MKRLAPLFLLLALVTPALAADKPLAPGTYTVKGCPTAAQVCAQEIQARQACDAALKHALEHPECTPCADPPAPVQVQPLPVGMHALSHAVAFPDRAAVRPEPVEIAPAPARRLRTWQKVALGIGGAAVVGYIVGRNFETDSGDGRRDMNHGGPDR